jgi:hypothetical protein
MTHIDDTHKDADADTHPHTYKTGGQRHKRDRETGKDRETERLRD